jgi:hypothetical protein
MALNATALLLKRLKKTPQVFKQLGVLKGALQPHTHSLLGGGCTKLL